MVVLYVLFKMFTVVIFHGHYFDIIFFGGCIILDWLIKFDHDMVTKGEVMGVETVYLLWLVGVDVV